MIIHLSFSVSNRSATLGDKNNNFDQPKNWVAIAGMTELSRQIKERAKAIEQLASLFSYLGQYRDSPITKAINSCIDADIKRTVKPLRNKISYSLSCNYYTATIVTNFLHPTV